MTPEETKELIETLYRIEYKLEAIEEQLFNKLRINMVIDVSDDKVHMVKQIVNKWETPGGVVIQVR